MISLDKEIVSKYIVFLFSTIIHILIEFIWTSHTHVLLIDKCYEYDVIEQEMLDSIDL